MLDFIADNYLWFIVLGAVLLVIALILLFTRKKPIKEDTNLQVPNGEQNKEAENVLVTEDTETLEIVDDTVQVGAEAAATAFTFVPPTPSEEVKTEVVEEVDPFSFESEVVTEEKSEQLFEETITEPISVDTLTNTEELTFDEPVSIEEPASQTLITEVPTVNDEIVEEILPENSQEQPINVGNVVMPQENVNKDNVPVNNEEDIWKF